MPQRGFSERTEGPRQGLICFGQFTIDLDRGSLRQDGKEIWLRPKSFAVLCYLAENAGRLILKEEIFATLWPDAAVTDDSLVQCIGEVRRALRDDYRRIVRTIPRRGYLFSTTPGPRSDIKLEPTSAAVASPRSRPTLACPDKPSIAVMPFLKLGNGPEQAHFADGIVEDIVTIVSQPRWFHVMARGSGQAREGRAIDAMHIGLEADVDYVLEGCVREAAGRIRVTARLIDARTGAYLWAARYDRELDDVFAVQDKISACISAAVISTAERSERERVAAKSPASLSAWECYHRGLWHYAKAQAAENALALRFFERALEFDTRFAAAHAAMARTLATEVVRFQPPSGRQALIPRAVEHARRSVALDPGDAVGRGALALMLLHTGEHDQASAEADLAVNLDPNSALAYGYRGAALAFGGRPRDATQPLETAMRVSPFDPLRPDWLHYLARAYYWMCDYPAAAAGARQLCQSYPSFRPAYGILIASLGQMRQRQEALRVTREAIKRFGNRYPARLMTKPPEFRLRDHQHLVEGYRMAGVARE